MKARLLVLLVGFALLTLLLNPYPAAEAQSKITYAKLSPWVIEHTQDGQTAEFLVVLNEQADLSGAEQLETKEEKGRFVYNVLMDKAQATQKPLLDWLKANGIEHRSFYIVNMVWVKGDLKVALALAARPEVARIEGNPLIHNRPLLPEAMPEGQPSAIAAIE